MFKLRFFVKAIGWIDGGYENVHYFRTRHEAETWLAKPWNACCSVISIEHVNAKDAVKDIIL